GFLVEGDAEAGLRGRQEVAALELHLLRENVGQDRAGAARQLQDAEVRDGKRKVEAGRSGNRPQRVVRRQVDVVRLAPAGDLLRLGDAARNAEVHAGVVDQLRLDQLAELPLRRELLAGSQGRVHVAAKLVEAAGVLGAERVLQKVGAVRLQRAA